MLIISGYPITITMGGRTTVFTCFNIGINGLIIVPSSLKINIIRFLYALVLVSYFLNYLIYTGPNWEFNQRVFNAFIMLLLGHSSVHVIILPSSRTRHHARCFRCYTFNTMLSTNFCRKCRCEDNSMSMISSCVQVTTNSLNLKLRILYSPTYFSSPDCKLSP